MKNEKPWEIKTLGVQEKKIIKAKAKKNLQENKRKFKNYFSKHLQGKIV